MYDLCVQGSDCMGSSRSGCGGPLPGDFHVKLQVLPPSHRNRCCPSHCHWTEPASVGYWSIAKELLFFPTLLQISTALASCIQGLFSFKCWGKACRKPHLQLHYTCKSASSFCASHRSAVDQDLERIGIAISTIPLHLLSFGASPLQVGLVARQFHGKKEAVWWESGNILELLPWHGHTCTMTPSGAIRELTFGVWASKSVKAVHHM